MMHEVFSNYWSTPKQVFLSSKMGLQKPTTGKRSNPKNYRRENFNQRIDFCCIQIWRFIWSLHTPTLHWQFTTIRFSLPLWMHSRPKKKQLTNLQILLLFKVIDDDNFKTTNKLFFEITNQISLKPWIEKLVRLKSNLKTL